MTADLSFGVTAAIILLSALFVVRSRNLIHAVLWLAVTLLATAALYALLDAPFLAGVQVLTYVGGVITLTIFGVMVTRRSEGAAAPASNASDERGFIAASALFAVLALAIWKTPFPASVAAAPTSTAQLARALLEEHLLAFEAASLLLLAAIIGAVVLARRRDPDPVAARQPVAGRALAAPLAPEVPR